MIDFFLEPLQYAFMKKALVSCLCLALGAGPIGVLLVLRRMSLMGDALSHALLPGVAVGYILGGFSLIAMGFGGLTAGLIMALLAGLTSRFTQLKEDASFAGFFLIALSLGVLLISLKHSAVDLTHILFGSALSVDDGALISMGIISSLTLVILACIYRPLLIECFDPAFLKSTQGTGGYYQVIFLGLVVLNLVSGFATLGTLLSLGIMMLPAISARFWAKQMTRLFLLAILIAATTGFFGLIFSYHTDWPSGPTIVLLAGIVYLVSLVFGTQGSLLHHRRYKKL
jgi:zinc/manganese transport system permease protein